MRISVSDNTSATRLRSFFRRNSAIQRSVTDTILALQERPSGIWLLYFRRLKIFSLFTVLLSFTAIEKPPLGSHDVRQSLQNASSMKF